MVESEDDEAYQRQARERAGFHCLDVHIPQEDVAHDIDNEILVNGQPYRPPEHTGSQDVEPSLPDYGFLELTLRSWAHMDPSDFGIAVDKGSSSSGAKHP